MATGTQATTARNLQLQTVHFLRKTIAYTDNGSTLTVGIIPAGSTILYPISGVQVNVVFDGNATNTLDVGASTDSGTNNFATALSLGTIAFVPLDVTSATMNVSVDTTIQVLVTSTAAAAAGSGEVIICYIPDIDG